MRPLASLTITSPSIHAESTGSRAAAAAIAANCAVQSLPLRENIWHFAVRDAAQHAVAVVLDLVQPAVAVRRCVDERRELAAPWHSAALALRAPVDLRRAPRRDFACARTAGLHVLRDRSCSSATRGRDPRRSLRGASRRDALRLRLDDVRIGAGRAYSSSSLISSQLLSPPYLPPWLLARASSRRGASRRAART